jgi:hypothetical protein
MPDAKSRLKRQWDAAMRACQQLQCDFLALCKALFPGTQPANSVPLQLKGPEPPQASPPEPYFQPDSMP